MYRMHTTASTKVVEIDLQGINFLRMHAGKLLPRIPLIEAVKKEMAKVLTSKDHTHIAFSPGNSML